MNRLLHRLLYRLLPLRAYLLAVSRLYFLTLALGRGRHTRALEYAYHLPRLLRPGDTAIDIGANLGYYTRPMSRIVGPEGRVYAVEPVPVICEVLRRNLRGRDNVRILNCALGDGDRPVEMANDSVAAAGYFGTGRNFVDDGRNARGDAIRFKAQMRRGSSLFADVDRIDFIKCDIEGYECVVLGEMMPLVRRHHPTILVESVARLTLCIRILIVRYVWIYRLDIIAATLRRRPTGGRPQARGP